MSEHLSWNSHKNHYEILKEFYTLNKYLISEQLKDTLLDAIECMEYTMTAEGEDYKEDNNICKERRISMNKQSTVINPNSSDFWKEFYEIVSPDIDKFFTYYCSYTETNFAIYYKGNWLNGLIFNKQLNQFEWVDDEEPITLLEGDKEIKKSLSNAFKQLLGGKALDLCKSLQLKR